MLQTKLEAAAELLPSFHDSLIADYNRAKDIAAELRAIGSIDMALIWEQLAVFLQTSETYIFESTPA